MVVANQWGFNMGKEAIQEFINENINPGLEMHGGFLTAHDYDEGLGILYVIMGGGCQGCSAANETLKYSIDMMLKEEFSEIKEIQDATQHSAGANPYYA